MDAERSIEKRDREKRAVEKRENSSTAYTTVAVGAALLVAAVLVIITAGTPAAGIGFIIGAAACLGWGVPRIAQQRRALPEAATEDRERELLSALRNNGGSLTPAEAAMETSLTVKEADEMLSGLANGGHLLVGSEGGALRYSLPSRPAQPELGGQAGS